MTPKPLGKLPKKHDARNLKLARYLRKLPVPPKAVDRASRLPANCGMMGNDVYGDCTMAAAGHMIQSWTTYAERGTLTLPDQDIIDAYLAISPNDQGAAMLDALNHWRKVGVGPDKIEAYVEIDTPDLTQAKLAIQYFGSCYIGMSLPDDAVFGPWRTPVGAPNWNNGHAVCLVAYDDATGLFRCCTWGAIWYLSYAWLGRYCDEAYAVLNDISLIQATGKSPEGFDWAQLERDLQHIGDPVTVEPDPLPIPEPPAPTPEPIPGPKPGGCLGMAALMAVMFAALIYGASELLAAGYRWYQPPTKTQVNAQVRWVGVEEARAVCKGGEACYFESATGNADLIVAVQPKDFNDERRIMILGHEFFHALGAQHD